MKKASNLLEKNGTAIFADPYIAEYSTEIERKLCAANLGYEYLISSIKKNASNDVVEATIDILFNDVFELEFKTSIRRMKNILIEHFNIVDLRKMWPKFDSEFGDYFFICNHHK